MMGVLHHEELLKAVSVILQADSQAQSELKAKAQLTCGEAAALYQRTCEVVLTWPACHPL